MQNLTLITALGTDADLVMELVDFFNGGDRFRYNSESTQIRESFEGRKLDRLYLLCTGDERVGKTLDQVRDCLKKEYSETIVESIPLPFVDLCCNKDDLALKNIVYETVRSRVSNGEPLIIASAGRKTMTNRLIEAGLMYGCEGYLSITAASAQPGIRFATETFNVLWIPARQFSEEKRENLGEIQEGIGNNFRSLYLLPSAVVGRLRSDMIGSDESDVSPELEWLRKLPKADLHCHLGGAFSPELLRQLADLVNSEFQVDVDKVKGILEQKIDCKLHDISGNYLKNQSVVKEHCLGILERKMREIDIPRYQLMAVLVSNLSTEQIEELSYDGLDQEDIRNKSLDWYMHCGDLGGSSLLQSRAALRLALYWLLEELWRDGCLYTEIRCSPGNYTQAGLSIRDVMETLIDEGRKFMAEHDSFNVNFIIMATRHKAVGAMISHVSAAVVYSQVSESERCERSPRVVGFDLAGQEENHDPALYSDVFLPLHHHFINITIHAGEMEEDEKIWQALYLLHAKRIGHGLKLINNERMMGYVRDYGIGIELCPSSNIQTNSFRKYSTGENEGESYPLRIYLEKGINVTINTDNLGISQTVPSKELKLACQLTEGGLSRWDVMKLCKNSLRAVFLPKDEKDRLLKKADKRMYQLILDEYFPQF